MHIRHETRGQPPLRAPVRVWPAEVYTTSRMGPRESPLPRMQSCQERGPKGLSIRVFLVACIGARLAAGAPTISMPATRRYVPSGRQSTGYRHLDSVASPTEPQKSGRRTSCRPLGSIQLGRGPANGIVTKGCAGERRPKHYPCLSAGDRNCHFEVCGCAPSIDHFPCLSLLATIVRHSFKCSSANPPIRLPSPARLPWVMHPGRRSEATTAASIINAVLLVVMLALTEGCLQIGQAQAVTHPPGTATASTTRVGLPMLLGAALAPITPFCLPIRRGSANATAMRARTMSSISSISYTVHMHQ